MKRAFLIVALCLPAMIRADDKRAPGFDTTVQPFLKKNCHACHNAKLRTADVDLEALSRPETLAGDPDLWEKAALKIRTGEMPPKGVPRPAEADVKAAVAWIDGEFARLERMAKPDPGRVTARRLNRTEYNNTVRDLLGIDLRPADDFPQDDSGYGFDNIGDVLSLSPVLLEKYMAAAEKIVRQALFGPPASKPVVARYQPPYRDYPLSPEPQFDYDETGLSMPQSLHTMHRFPVDGEYVFKIVPEGRRPTGSEPITMLVWIDGKQVAALETQGHVAEGSIDLFGREREARIHVTAGDHWVAGSVLKMYEGLPAAYGGPNPSKQPEPAAGGRRGGFTPRIPDNLTPEQAEAFKKKFEERLRRMRTPANRAYIHILEISGPFEQSAGPSEASLKQILTCGHLQGPHAAGCERRIIGDMARRAFRRPVGPLELRPYMNLAAKARQQGGSFEEGIAVALQGLLVSPDFLFRIEHASTPRAAASTARPIGQYELASRISYFLWSSTPDEELLRAAGQGTLRKPEVVKAQVARMLKDPRSQALVKNFGGQWLETRRLESVAPDRDKFPEFEEYLRLSMQQETELFFDHILREDRSVVDFIDGKYTFLNQRLAEHYGVPNVKGQEFRKVDLSGTPRAGLITQASVLTVSSYATRTSPVLRGKWILENILNAPPPPPPPDVPALDEAKSGVAASLRAQMEQHRSNAVCASCHARMDPLGFGLENFNAIGMWRGEDGKFPVDASGTLPDGRTFQGPEDLVKLLRQDKDDFARAITEKMLTYALGRGLERYDRRTVREIAARVAASDYRFSSLMVEIIQSLPFQNQREELKKT